MYARRLGRGELPTMHFHCVAQRSQYATSMFAPAVCSEVDRPKGYHQMITKIFSMLAWFRTARFVSLFAASVVLAICAMIGTTAQGSPIAFAGLEWKMSEKEQVLIDANDMMSMKGVMWDVPAQRRQERNMPFIEVKNQDNSDANLTEFRMTIGDTRFNFSNEMYADYAMVSPSSDFLDVSTSSTNGDDLIVKFNGAGLAPGELVRFRIDIGIDDNQPGLMQIWPHPDYRTVLFDMNGINAWGPSPMTPMPPDSSDNSMAVGTWTKDGMSASSLMPVAFPDPTVVGPQAAIFNQFFRPFYVVEDVDIFSAVQVIGVIPEPSSMLLAFIGMTALGLVAHRRSGAGRRDYTNTTTVAYRRQSDPRPQRQLACRHRLSRRAAR
jgi:hypothetical protein